MFEDQDEEDQDQLSSSRRSRPEAFTVVVPRFLATNPGSTIPEISEGIGRAIPYLYKVTASLVQDGVLTQQDKKFYLADPSPPDQDFDSLATAVTDFLRERPASTVGEIAEALGQTARQLQRPISRLVREGVLERHDAAQAQDHRYVAIDR